MANTTTFSDVLNIVGKQIPRVGEDYMSGVISSLALNLIWHEYDWRDSLATLPPFYVIAGEQDHFRPIANIPADFWGLRQTFITRILSGIVETHEMMVIKDLRITNLKALPSSICWDPTFTGFRLFPRMPLGMSAPNYFVQGTYKKLATKITALTINSIIPWDDQYLPNFIAVFRWAAFESMGDPHAGQVQYDGNKKVYTGQLALAMAMIDEMASWEGVNNGDPVVAPSQPLVGAGVGLNFPWSTWFGAS